MPNGTHGCRYCDGFLRAGALYCSASCNTRLLESRNFVVVPTVGMIVPGWLLLLTKEHVPNMATIPASWHAEMSDLLRQAKALLSRHFSPPFVFEHGADPKHKVNCGSCVDHAHLHLIPSTHHAQIETDILAAHEFFSVPDLNKLSDLRFGDTGYLYYESIAGQAYACPLYFGLLTSVFIGLFSGCWLKTANLLRRILGPSSQSRIKWASCHRSPCSRSRSNGQLSEGTPS